MAVRPVLRLPHGLLKQPARPIEPGDEAAALARDLLDTMAASPACVGLAAPQIGVARRMIVVDVSRHPKTTVSHGVVVMLDPMIATRSGKEVGREGCMSVPHLTANVARATSLVVVGRDLEGAPLRMETEGFEARALQHEVDHLDGVLILDRVASVATDVFRRKTYR